MTSPAGPDRRVPGWASALVGGLTRDAPAVVTRGDIGQRSAALGLDRDLDATINGLRRLGWLVALPVKGTWAFVPPGQDAVTDPYLPLRAWQARDRNAEFLLAGEAAALHLGYVDRRSAGRISVWKPSGCRLPDGLRPYVSVVSIGWGSTSPKELRPSTAFLARRHLDVVGWASGLPAFGPEALLVQLGARPASFAPWVDLVAHLEQLVDDCDDDKLAMLLTAQTASTWQRAAYLLHAGGQPTRGSALLDRKPAGPTPKVSFEHPSTMRGDRRKVWIPQYYVVDRLLAPLQKLVGKA
ncbi:MAG: type IV toxin-antitoxin system AbiEi family antitoxin [Nitriliruptorales bacterium]